MRTHTPQQLAQLVINNGQFFKRTFLHSSEDCGPWSSDVVGFRWGKAVLEMAANGDVWLTLGPDRKAPDSEYGIIHAPYYSLSYQSWMRITDRLDWLRTFEANKAIVNQLYRAKYGKGIYPGPLVDPLTYPTRKAG